MTEMLESIELANSVRAQFSRPDKAMFNKRVGEFETELIMMEVFTKNPPTDISINLGYTEKNEGEIKYIDIHFIKFIKDFNKYENGRYIVYLDDVEIFPKGITPYAFSFVDKRDGETKIR